LHWKIEEGGGEVLSDVVPTTKHVSGATPHARDKGMGGKEAKKDRILDSAIKGRE